MKRTLKNSLLISLVFGIYQMLISLFFGSYRFLDSNLNLFLYLLIVLFVLSITEGVFLYFFLKEDKARGVNKILFVSSFLISALVGGSLTWLIGSGKNNYLLYAGSFLIASFLPTVLFLLYFIYKDAEEKIAGIGKVSMKTSDDKDQVIEKVFHLENDNGKLLLEVPVNKIICYEANDNYVITYYLDKNDQLKKSMERISLKRSRKC